MRLFLHHYLGIAPVPMPAREAPVRPATAAIEAVIRAQCDEESLARAA
jgi:hypothetical protein